MKLSTMILIVLLIFLPFIVNFVKLTNCDFESNYKCEVIHGLGVVVPPFSYITVWFDDDSDS